MEYGAETGSLAGWWVIACLFYAVFGLVGIAAFAFWLWMLIDCATKCPSAESKKLIWVLIIILVNLPGAIIYYFVQRPKNPPTGPAAGPPPGA